MKLGTSRLLGPRRRDARGQVLVLFALVLVVLLLVSALAVDYGGWLVARRNYQNVADAASLAGAQQLTRAVSAPCPSGGSKQFCARVAAWSSVKTALKLTALDPTAQAAVTTFSTAYEENGFRLWVASPPSDAGSALLGKISGPGVVYVRVEHAQASYFSRIASIGATVTSWATAGRFPANFAVIALCRPAAGDRCLAEDTNIKIDGTNSILVVETGDLGTNAWTKTAGNNSAIGLGPDSNAYMEEFNTCWAKATNQCQLVNFVGGAPDYSNPRSAVPLGAPIVDPGYPAPPISGTTTPNQCRGTAPVVLASAPVSPDGAPGSWDGGIQLAAAVGPIAQPGAPNGAPGNATLQGFVRAAAGGALLGGMNVTATNGTTTYTLTTGNNGPNTGKYSKTRADTGTYSITASDPAGTYHDGTITGVVVGASGTVTAPDINLQKNPVIAGTVRDALTNAALAGATITITGPSGPYTATTNGAGAYSVIITGFGTFGAYDVTASKSGYVSNTVNSGLLGLDATTTVNVALTPSPASLGGTITDQVTTLPIPGVTVTLGSGQTTTTDSSGTYDFATVSPGSTTITLSGTAMDGYMTGAPTTPPSPYTYTIASGANDVDFQAWPKGCGTANRDKGSWSCSWPSGNNCPATTNLNGPDVTCTFTGANAIRPGTYEDIDIDGCAWIDPKGGATGLAAGQSAGIVHITGTLSMSNDSYLFGDGVTIVMDHTASINVGNGGGFVLNFGSIASGSPLACNLATVKRYNDGFTPCFRTVPTIDGQDYAYGAWTTEGHQPWACTVTTPPTYDDSCVNKGQELGITFYLYGSSTSRWKIATANMGYLFNGVLYGPNDDIEMGGGKDGQSAAGQIVGWTIEYHGGTRILQNWYGDPVDGPPFLIEPILGE
jgi:hypothetical protein